MCSHVLQSSPAMVPEQHARTGGEAHQARSQGAGPWSSCPRILDRRSEQFAELLWRAAPDEAVNRVLRKRVRLDRAADSTDPADGRDTDLFVRDSSRQILYRSPRCAVDGHVIDVTGFVPGHPASVREALSGVRPAPDDESSSGVFCGNTRTRRKLSLR